ncbi:oxidative stress defense protein [Holospora elegans E1]|uniref:Oxidative stress defense protein n=1 Tax=Holospora elegans E1 TaxID=1427503 RepID=A0A023DYX6_9PROT|nr:SIMPL domain-containing protein [Holospora elegans]GAJ46210.1 oxidative stress defense protein [Holospora elegans E1]
MKEGLLKRLFLASLCIFASIMLAHLITHVIQKLSERSFEVRGVAEKEVKSDLASWRVSVTLLSADIASATTSLEEFKTKFFEFCKEQKIDDADPERCQVEICDNWAEKGETQEDKNSHYSVKMSIQVDSKDVDKVREAKSKLLARIPSFPIRSSLDFIYTKFDSIRDQMVRESFQDAKRAAQCIAKSAGVSIEKVKKLSQGLFTITDSETATHLDTGNQSVMKTIRTVSSVVFIVQ